MKRPIVEFYYKNDDLGDPMINADYAEAFGLATDAQVAEIKACALKINEILKAFLAERKVRLIDFKMEFGVDADGKVILADEITPDTSRLWDWDTNEKLDKTVSAVIWAASKKPIRNNQKTDREIISISQNKKPTARSAFLLYNYDKINAA